MEPGEIARWQRRLGSGWEVIPRTRFGARYGLASAFRGASRPDMVAVHHGRRRVLVGDVTARPDADHLGKTIAYARRLAAQLPPSLVGYRVLAQDWYWALPPEYGPRSWPTSKRILVAPTARARARARGARAARVLPAYELGEGFTPRVLTVLRGEVIRGGQRRPVFRVAPRTLSAAEARRALKARAGVFLLGADKNQARQWLLSLLPAREQRLVHEVHEGGRPHWHIGAGDNRTGHVFYGPRRPRASFFTSP
jgi:hypothetical protein